jgi:hypothetical protein
MKRPVIGLTVYSLNVGNARHGGREQKLTPLIVTAIGRKYFTCHREGWTPNESNGIQFHLANWREKAEVCVDHELYETEQAWLDKKEADIICHELWKAFEYGRNVKSLPLETLRRIKELISQTPDNLTHP